MLADPNLNLSCPQHPVRLGDGALAIVRDGPRPLSLDANEDIVPPLHSGYAGPMASAPSPEYRPLPANSSTDPGRDRFLHLTVAVRYNNPRRSPSDKEPCSGWDAMVSGAGAWHRVAGVGSMR